MSKKIAKRVLSVVGLMLLAVFLAGVFAGKRGDQRESSLRPIRHHNLPDDVDRAPIAVHVSRYVVFDEPATRDEVRRAMQTERAGAIKQYPDVTNLAVYGFVSDDNARDGMGTWIAMTFSTVPFSDVEIRFDEGRFNAAWQAPSERFGLSEPQRRALFKELVIQEDRATTEAEKAHSGDTREELMNRATAEHELRARYTEELAKARGIPVDSLRAISVEALIKGWPFPK